MAMINFGARKKDGKYVCQDCGMLIDSLLPHADACDRSAFHDPEIIDWSNGNNSYDCRLIR